MNYIYFKYNNYYIVIQYKKFNSYNYYNNNDNNNNSLNYIFIYLTVQHENIKFNIYFLI